MRPDLEKIDTSPIADLVRIRKEEAVLEERLAKMQAKNERVSPEVYARVKSDYEARRSELARSAQPLRERALREYQRLKEIRAEVDKEVQQAALDKEELEFRRDLGEFPEEDFRARAGECESRLAEARRHLDEVLKLRGAFAAAFRSEEELESGAAAAPPRAPSREQRPFAAPPAAPPAPAVAPVPPVPPPPAPPLHDVTPDGTAITSPRAFPMGGARPGPEDETVSPSHSGTAILPRARLSLLDGERVAREYPLKVGVSVIGRLAQSDIHIPSPDVSRRHAQVTMGPDGCTISDLGSENGVVVNGHHVEKHRLEDGDVVILGKQRLVFHT